MRFNAKLRRIGNSVGVIIPRDIWKQYAVGDIITLENVITERNEDEVQKLREGFRGEAGDSTLLQS